jgi:hypothetical protein
MVMTFVRLGLGVGLVPQWPWVFQEYEQQGQIVAIPVEDLSPVRLALFAPKCNAERSRQIKEMVEVIDAHINHLHDRITLRTGQRDSKLPKVIKPFTHGYYVSCSKTGCTRWRRCLVVWSNAKRGDVSGTVTDDDAPNKDSYSLRGELDEKLLHWRATATNARKDRYVAAFTTVTVSPESLVGTWTGFDDDERPASGPFILSRCALNRQELDDITRIAQLNMFLNAEQMVADEAGKCVND